MQQNKFFYFLVLITSIFFTSCKNGGLNIDGEKPLFTLTDSSETGFFFWNELDDNEELNSFNYGYFYNGGGVAVGDINNDGLPDIYMVGCTFGGRLFLNTGNFTFQQITETSNSHTNGFTHGVVMEDVNQDGFLDIYLSRSMSNIDSQRANRLFINNGDNTFTERAKEYGIADEGFTTQSNFFDYDNDGDPDLYVLNHSIYFDLIGGIITPEQRLKKLRETDPNDYLRTVSKLYRNNGNGTFTDVSEQAGLKQIMYGLSATVSDINNDGWLDLYCTSDFADQDHLYFNNGNGTFTDVTHDVLGHISMFTMGSDIADVNNDGLLDIMTADMMAEDNYRHKQFKANYPYDLFKMSMDYGYHCQVVRNCLHINNGAGQFSEIGQLAGISHTDWSWAPLFADFDNDGRKDLFVSNGYYKDLTDMDFVAYGSDEIIKKAQGKENVKFMDFINAITSTPLQNYIFKNVGNSIFEKISDDWGLTQKSFSNGAAYADLDLDGDLDLIVNNFNEPSFLYKNNSVENNAENKFLSFIFLPKQHSQVQGTKVQLFTDSGLQYQQLINNHGFLSSMHQLLHFGLGKNNSVQRVEIEYPNGTIEEIKSPVLNKQMVLDITKGVVGKFEKPTENKAVQFSEVENAFSPAYFYKESDFIDFKDEPLLEQMYSNRGPFASKGDVNNDGLEDLYLSGAAGMEACLYLQTKAGKFIKKPNAIFAQDKHCEDGQSVFFDADGDKDLDLYVTSGSNEVRDEKLFLDRLYINEGTGIFTKSSTLPNIKSNTLSVEAIDVDKDGDLDLFVGGNVVPKQFPKAFASYILKNNKGVFTADYNALPNNGMLGIINDIDQLDINGDKKMDIVLAGDWLPITILTNGGKLFKNETEKYGFEKTNGMWNCLTISDINGDGKKDIIGGNRGLNGFFTCSNRYPATLYVDDFDDNGETEAVVNYYFRDYVLYPKYSLNELLEQIPSWRGQFPRYNKYSLAKSEDIFTTVKYPNMQTFYCYMFESAAFLSGKNNEYTMTSLPVQSQYSQVYSLAVFDVKNIPYLLAGGNNYGVDVNQARLDASMGSLQFWNGVFFENVSFSNGPFEGELRQFITLRDHGKEKLLVLKANSNAIIVAAK